MRALVHRTGKWRVVRLAHVDVEGQVVSSHWHVIRPQETSPSMEWGLVHKSWVKALSEARRHAISDALLAALDRQARRHHFRGVM